MGGDWYDAFELPDGSIGLVIGDVVGHDLHAATRMGAIRHKLRGIAVDRLAAPAQVIGRLDAVVQALSPGDLATLLYARLTTTAAEEDRDGAADGERGRAWTVEWTSAGHPPPLMLPPGGAAVLLATEPDLPIGVAAGPRTDQRLRLVPGAVLVLYTDGLVERVGEPLGTGLARLVRNAEALRHAPVADLVDRLVATTQPEVRDDVAVLAVRVP